MIRWALVGNETQEDQIVLVTCVAGMLFTVDHKGEVDAALLSGRITYSKKMPSKSCVRAGRLAGQTRKTQTCDELLRPCSRTHSVFKQEQCHCVTHFTGGQTWVTKLWCELTRITERSWVTRHWMPVSGSGQSVKGKGSCFVLSSHSLARKYLYCCNVCHILCYSDVPQWSKVAFCSPFVSGITDIFVALSTQELA